MGAIRIHCRHVTYVRQNMYFKGDLLIGYHDRLRCNGVFPCNPYVALSCLILDLVILSTKESELADLLSLHHRLEYDTEM